MENFYAGNYNLTFFTSSVTEMNLPKITEKSVLLCFEYYLYEFCNEKYHSSENLILGVFKNLKKLILLIKISHKLNSSYKIIKFRRYANKC